MGYYGCDSLFNAFGKSMSTYLDTSKIQAAGRLSLSQSALRNLKIGAGDSVEIFFDESLGCLLILPVKNENSTNDTVAHAQGRGKEKKR